MRLRMLTNRTFLAATLSLMLLVPAEGMLVTQARTVRANLSVSRELRTADQEMQTGRFDKAEDRYTRILQKQPGNTEARASLSFAQAELYKLDAAEKNAKTVFQRDPSNVMAHVALGIVNRNRTASQDMEYRGRREHYLSESARYLEQAVSLDPRSPEALNELGTTYRFMGRKEDAQKAFEKAIAVDPHYAEPLLNQGILKMEQGQTEEARKDFERAVRMNSKNHMAHYRMGEAYLALNDPHRALKSLNTSLALNPGNAAVMTKMGEAYEAQGNYPAAIASYRKSINASPSFMPAYVGLSNLYDSRGDGELAMAELKSALIVNPKYNTARNQLGRLALSVDKPDQAMRYYQESLAQNPSDPEALQGLSQALMTVAAKSSSDGQALGQESDLVAAEQAIDEALRVNPNDLRLHLASLRINQLSGKPEASYEKMESILQSPAQNDSERMVQGEALMALGRYEDADQLFRSMMDEASRDPNKLVLIGDTLKINGDLTGARQAYQLALNADPQNLKAERGIQRLENSETEAQKSLRLAKALNNWRQKESSIDYYEESLSRTPRQPKARLELSKLYEKFDMYDKAAYSYQHYLGLMPGLTERERMKYEKKIRKMQELSAKNLGTVLTQSP